jgi:methionyl-tRNA formyltransferase
MRLVFAGTPATALPSLRALLTSRHEVVAVLTRPDAAAGRGRRLTPSPVADAAQHAGIETLKPATPREPAFLARLAQLTPDCCPVVAYGGLIPDPALLVPPHGWVNLHFSVLPAWRGAAPVQRALIAGDEVTGATTFRLVQELDAGPTYGCCTETIRADDTAGTLLDRLADHGADLLVATVDGIEDGTLEPRPQPVAGVSLAPKLTVEDGRVGWSHPAYVIDRLVRGCTPSPGAWTLIDGHRLKLRPVKLRPEAGGEAASNVEALSPGEVRIAKAEVLVGTGTCPVALGEVQPPGKPWLPAADWGRGLRGGVRVLGR